MEDTVVLIGHEDNCVLVVVEDSNAEITIRLRPKNAEKLISAIRYQISEINRTTATKH